MLNVDGDVQYVALADNGLFCTPSDPTSVTSYQAPGQAAATIDVQLQDQNAGAYGIRISGARASGRVDHFAYSTDGQNYRTMSGNTDWVADPQWGADTGVSVIACADDTSNFCGPASDVQRVRPVLTRASIPDSYDAGSPVTVSAAPQNTGAGPQQYRVTFCPTLNLGINCTSATYAPDALPTVPASGTVTVAAIVDGHEDSNPPTSPVNAAPEPELTTSTG
jgi:hypothetical protein